jgi:hypothetical protein
VPNLSGNRLSIDYPSAHRGPIGGPGVWYGAGISESLDWAYPLSGAEQGELIDAMREALQDPNNIATITKADFPLEGFDFAEVAAMYWGAGRASWQRAVAKYARTFIGACCRFG